MDNDSVKNQEQLKERSKKIKKSLFYLLCFLITIGLLLLIINFTGDFKKAFANLTTLNYGWFMVAFLFGCIYSFLNPLTLCIFAKAEQSPAKFRRVYLIGMSEDFFDGITPFATGGQPYQTAALTHQKTKASTATGVILMNYLIHLLVCNVYALLSLLYLSINGIFKDLGLVPTIFAIVGYAINFTVFICTIIVGTSKTVNRFLLWCMNLLCKIKFLTKILQPQVVKFQEYVDNSQSAFKGLWKNKKAFFLAFGVKMITYFFFYAVTFFALQSLPLQSLNIKIDGFSDFLKSIAVSSFSITMAVFFPTPGTSGGVEGSYAVVFENAFGIAKDTGYGQSTMLIWRFITYYLPIFLGLFAYIIYEIVMNKEKKKLKTSGSTDLEINKEETTNCVQVKQEGQVEKQEDTTEPAKGTE